MLTTKTVLEKVEISARFWRFTIPNAIRLHDDGIRRKNAAVAEIGRALCAGKNVSVEQKRVLRDKIAQGVDERAPELAKKFPALVGVYPFEVKRKDEWAKESAQIKKGYMPLSVWAPQRARGASEKFLDVPVFDITGTTAKRLPFRGLPPQKREMAVRAFLQRKGITCASLAEGKKDVAVTIDGGHYKLSIKKQANFTFAALCGYVFCHITNEVTKGTRMPMDAQHTGALIDGAAAILACWLGEAFIRERAWYEPVPLWEPRLALPPQALPLLEENRGALLTDAHDIARSIIRGWK